MKIMKIGVNPWARSHRSASVKKEVHVPPLRGVVEGTPLEGLVVEDTPHGWLVEYMSLLGVGDTPFAKKVRLNFIQVCIFSVMFGLFLRTFWNEFCVCTYPVKKLHFGCKFFRLSLSVANDKSVYAGRPNHLKSFMSFGYYL